MYLMLYNVFECMHATMEHRERPMLHGAMKRHAVSMMSLKDGIFCIGLYGGSARALSITYFYTVECASCAEALNMPIKVFLHAY